MEHRNGTSHWNINSGGASTYLQLLSDRTNVGDTMPLSNSEEDNTEDKLVTDEVKRICPVPVN